MREAPKSFIPRLLLLNILEVLRSLPKFPWEEVIIPPRKTNQYLLALPLAVLVMRTKMLVGSLGTLWSPLGLLAPRGPLTPFLPVLGTGRGEAGASWILARTALSWLCKLIYKDSSLSFLCLPVGNSKYSSRGLEFTRFCLVNRSIRMRQTEEQTKRLIRQGRGPYKAL